MTVFWIRVFIYNLLPLLLAALLVRVDRRARGRVRRTEVFLIYLLGLGVTGSGIGGFAGHLFLSDLVAESIGWETGSPFQLEMGFANLALAVLGIMAIGRRDGYREATAVAVTVLGVGASIVHVVDIVGTGNLAPGNTVQIISNLLKPALLIAFLSASRRAERETPAAAQGPAFDRWRAGHAQAAGWMAALVASGFAVGYGVGSPVLATVAGVVVGGAAVALTLSRARER